MSEALDYQEKKTKNKFLVNSEEHHHKSQCRDNFKLNVETLAMIVLALAGKWRRPRKTECDDGNGSKAEDLVVAQARQNPSIQTNIHTYIHTKINRTEVICRQVKKSAENHKRKCDQEKSREQHMHVSKQMSQEKLARAIHCMPVKNQHYQCIAIGLNY